MTIWIDPPAWPAHGRLWSHLVSDTSYDELHAFAEAHGVPRRGFEGDHYDVPQERYDQLVAGGAQAVGGRELVRILMASGLRVPKRRHERVVASHAEPAWLPPGSRADVIASQQDEPPANTVVVRLALWHGPDLLVLERLGGGGLDLPSAPVAGLTPIDARDRLAGVVLGTVPVPELPLLGYVRNTVPDPDDEYPWPVPRAAFTVFGGTLPEGARPAAGTWLEPARFEAELSARHWWPLLDPVARRHG